MEMPVSAAIYFYIFICVVLLAFNLLYMLWLQQVKFRRRRSEQRWRRELPYLIRQGAGERRKQLFRRLRKTEELMAFQAVLGRVAEYDAETVQQVFRENRRHFYALAIEYGKKNAMERAFFAYVLATYHTPVETRIDLLPLILLGYFSDSTVYCRENVLNALYVLGNARIVVQAFDQLNANGWYHHPRLLSDGLSRFAGDKEDLAELLWSKRDGWEEFLLLAVVRFADSLPDERLALSFLSALEHEGLPLEVRFTLIRYFQRHPIPEAEPELLRLLAAEKQEESRLAIAAAAVLSAYPDGTAREALKHALHSPDWYVRQNAAQSLRQLGITQTEIEQVQAEGDRYASEMLEYAAGRTKEPERLPAEEGTVAVV